MTYYLHLLLNFDDSGTDSVLVEGYCINNSDAAQTHFAAPSREYYLSTDFKEFDLVNDFCEMAGIARITHHSVGIGTDNSAATQDEDVYTMPNEEVMDQDNWDFCFYSDENGTVVTFP